MHTVCDTPLCVLCSDWGYGDEPNVEMLGVHRVAGVYATWIALRNVVYMYIVTFNVFETKQLCSAHHSQASLLSNDDKQIANA